MLVEDFGFDLFRFLRDSQPMFRVLHAKVVYLAVEIVKILIFVRIVGIINRKRLVVFFQPLQVFVTLFASDERFDARFRLRNMYQIVHFNLS